jgi:hypothetical protein
MAGANLNLGRGTSTASIAVPGEQLERITLEFAKSRVHPLSDIFLNPLRS